MPPQPAYVPSAQGTGSSEASEASAEVHHAGMGAEQARSLDELRRQLNTSLLHLPGPQPPISAVPALLVAQTHVVAAPAFTAESQHEEQPQIQGVPPEWAPDDKLDSLIAAALHDGMSPPTNDGDARSEMGFGVDRTSAGSTTPYSSRGSDSEEGDEQTGDVSVVPCSCIARLEVLDRELGEKIELLTRAVTTADGVCSEILHFFGLEAPAGPRLGGLAAQVLESLAQFMRQLRGAWEELEKHEKQHSGGAGATSGADSWQSTPRALRRWPTPRISVTSAAAAGEAVISPHLH